MSSTTSPAHRPGAPTVPTTTPPLTPVQLAALRDQLEEQRRFRVEQLAALDTTTATDDVTATLAEGAHVALRDVGAALHRMDEGSYGRCIECDRTLELTRLEVIPAMAYCLPCLSRVVTAA